MASTPRVTRVPWSSSSTRLSRLLLTVLVLCAPGHVSHYSTGPTLAHASWTPKEVLSTNDLSSNVYPAVGHRPCVLLVSVSGSVGCFTNGNEGGGGVAPLRAFESLADIKQRLKSSTIVLLPATAFPKVITAFIAATETGDNKATGWPKFVAGFLVDPGPGARAETDGTDGSEKEHQPVVDDTTKAAPTASAALATLLATRKGNVSAAHWSFSPQPKYPQKDLRSITDIGGPREWNPSGFDAVSRLFANLPIVLLDADGTRVARAFAAENGKGGTERVAEMRFAMTAAADAESNSLSTNTKKSTYNHAKACLSKRACQPIGGYSVVAAVGDTTQNSSSDLILVSARLDASALFHDAAFGADAGMSGLVVMLGVAKAFRGAIKGAQNAGELPIDKKQKPVAFAGFGAEAFGHAGSRRIAGLLYSKTNKVYRGAGAGGNTARTTHEETHPSALPKWLRGRSVSQVLDIGAVGFATRNGFGDEANIFAHVPKGVESSAAYALVDALTHAFATTSRDTGVANGTVVNATFVGSLVLKKASAATPLPPSSLLSFERLDKTLSGVVLTEYDSQFVDPFFGSAFDVGVDQVDPLRLAAVTESVTRYLVSAAFQNANDANAVARHVSRKDIHAVTEELVSCLIDPSIGFGCDVGQKLFTPTEVFPSRYAGVASPAAGARDFDSETDGKTGAGADDTARFVWEFLADVTGDTGEVTCDVKCARSTECAANEVCVRATGEWSSSGSGRPSISVSVPSSFGTSETKAKGRSYGDAFARSQLDANSLRENRRHGPIHHTRLPRRSLLGSELGFGDGDDDSKRNGRCVANAIRFVPAVSAKVTFDPDALLWVVEDDTDADTDTDTDTDTETEHETTSSRDDPIWCESNWPSAIGVRVFQVDSVASQWVSLALGAGITFVSYFVSKELETIARVRFKEE